MSYRFPLVIRQLITAAKVEPQFNRALKSGHGFLLQVTHYDPQLMPLAIAVIGFQRIAVAHLQQANGQTLRAPEYVFQVVAPLDAAREYAEQWGVIQKIDDTRQFYKRYDEPRQDSYLQQWANNIGSQGYISLAQAGHYEFSTE